MKKSILLGIVACALLAGLYRPAAAGMIVGRAVLKMQFSGGYAELNVREESDGKQNMIVGYSPLGPTKLTAMPGGYEGWIYGTRLKLACDAQGCSGTGLSGPANFKITDGGAAYEGGMNHNFIVLRRTETRLEVLSQNTLYLTKKEDGSWSGQGYFGRKSFSAELVFEGQADKFLKDPALLLAWLGSFFGLQP
ncbi:MAG: hypothetical protein WC881_00235 [Elusimicrobiota bacterium]|jgi:hypothetical protein